MSNYKCEHSGIEFDRKDCWISVKDRLPGFNKEVLLFENDYISIGELWDFSAIDESNRFTVRDHGTCDPTHWMPLPEPPNE